ncbi:hypothetical protein FIBSPDRAFT_847364, partial [Athelia psychrophila]
MKLTLALIDTCVCVCYESIAAYHCCAHVAPAPRTRLTRISPRWLTYWHNILAYWHTGSCICDSVLPPSNPYHSGCHCV